MIRGTGFLLILLMMSSSLFGSLAEAEALRFGLFKFYVPTDGDGASGKRVNALTDRIPGVGDLGVALVRHPLMWDCVERSKGKMDFGHCRQIKKIDHLLDHGVEVQLNIRTRVSSNIEGETFWATGRPAVAKRSISYAPLDIKSRWGEKGYSESYYNFISGVLKHYCDKKKSCRIKEIVIENEANSPHQWRASDTLDAKEDVSAYVRLVKTALKAVRDGGYPVKVYDSGLQGWTVVPLAVKEMFDRGDMHKAIEIYESVIGRRVSEKKVYAYLKKALGKITVKRTKLMLKSDLYQVIDGLNVHHYQTVDSIAPMLAFLRRNIPVGKKIISNEVGFKEVSLSPGFSGADDIVNKSLSLFSQGVNPVIWFSPEARSNAVHLVNAEGVMNRENTIAVQSLAVLLRDASSVESGACGNKDGFMIQTLSSVVRLCPKAHNISHKCNARKSHANVPHIGQYTVCVQ